jgi:hypothetical protein
MNNNDYTWWFAMLGISSLSIGLSNTSKNDEQVATQKRIEEKLDKLLEMINNERT